MCVCKRCGGLLIKPVSVDRDLKFLDPIGSAGTTSIII